jgi:hypothetical protein
LTNRDATPYAKWTSCKDDDKKDGKTKAKAPFDETYTVYCGAHTYILIDYDSVVWG